MSYEYIPGYGYNSPPAYVIIGHGKERKVNGYDDVKYRLENEILSFIVESGVIADHDVTEIVKGLSSDLNTYTDFSKEDGEYIDIDISYEPELELGGLYLMYRGTIQDIWTLENGPDTLSRLVEHVVDNHDEIMDTFLEENHFSKKYPKPEIRIWCLTCRVPFDRDPEGRREPVYEYPNDEEWYNNDAVTNFNRERQRWVNGNGNEPYESYQLTQLKLPINNYGDNGYVNGYVNGYDNVNDGYDQNGNDPHYRWGGKSIKRKKSKKKTMKKNNSDKIDKKIDKISFQKRKRKDECPRTYP